jgi:hypothetical protein
MYSDIKSIFDNDEGIVVQKVQDYQYFGKDPGVQIMQ